MGGEGGRHRTPRGAALPGRAGSSPARCPPTAPRALPSAQGHRQPSAPCTPHGHPSSPPLPSRPVPSRLLSPGAPRAVPRSPGAYRLGAAEGRRGGAQQQAQRGGGGEKKGEEEAEEQQRPRSRHGPAERPRGFRAPTWARGRGGTGPHLRRGRGGGAEPGSSVGLRGARPLLLLLLLLLRSPGRAPGPGARCLTLLWQEAAQHSTEGLGLPRYCPTAQPAAARGCSAAPPTQERPPELRGVGCWQRRGSDTAYNIKRTWALFRNLLAILK